MPVVLPGSVCAVFYGLHLPALREIFIVRLSDELPDNLSFRGAKSFDELLELALCGFVQPQHETLGIRVRIMGALL